MLQLFRLTCVCFVTAVDPIQDCHHLLYKQLSSLMHDEAVRLVWRHATDNM